MKRSALLSPLLALLLAGCAALQPHAPDMLAAVPLPAQWSVAPAAAAPTSIAKDWWTQLGDAQLDRLVAQALAQNNDLQTAMARVREAQAQLASAGAAQSPQLNATLGAQSGRSLGAFGPTHTRSLQPGLQASWELDVWAGCRSSNRPRARACRPAKPTATRWR